MTISVNSFEAIQTRLTEGHNPRYGPMLMLAGWQFGLYMFLTFVPLSVAMLAAYLRIRRLPPFIMAHWLMDLTNVLFLYQVG